MNAARDNGVVKCATLEPGEPFREQIEVSRRNEPTFTGKGESVVLDAHHHTLYPVENFLSRLTHGNEAREENRCGEPELR